MNRPEPVIAIFDGEFVVQLTHFELTISHDNGPSAEIQMMGYDLMQQFDLEMIEYIHISSGAKRYDFNGCYVVSNTVEQSSRRDEPVIVDMTIEAIDVTVHERI